MPARHMHVLIMFTLCVQGMATEHVRAAIQLEQWLMEGAYNKVCTTVGAATALAS